jgi:hypothetical protein
LPTIGRPHDDLPTTPIELRLTATAAETGMTMTSRFASIADLEQVRIRPAC